MSVITATIVLRNLEEIKIQYVDNKDSSVPTYKASVDILRVISARMTNPSRKIPVSGEYAVVYTEQDSLSFDDTKAITVLDGLRRCDCMKFADSMAASRYVWLDVASANRAETLVAVSQAAA